ncbi:MAG: sulfatase [Planctomycetota bacterium]
MTPNLARLVGALLFVASVAFVTTLDAQQLAAPKKRPNVLLLVADDMNWDTPGCFGGAAPDVTPAIDRLAAGGMRFRHAYVNISICTPSRSVILSGLYPNRNGAEGFQRIHAGTETLPAALNKAGFICGIVGKPLRQQELFRWSVTYRWKGVGDEDKWGRDPAVFRKFSRDFFAVSKTAGQPFFLMASSHDPHRPFGRGRAKGKHAERAPASRTYRASEVRLPGLLPDLPGMREDFADYATSVRRLDDMVGGVLEELETAGLSENTIVIFLADHGMPFPGAKFNCYPDSVRTPLIVRWPGRVEAGAIDSEHMVATVDLQATILEAVGLKAGATDGRSFLPILRGEKREGWDRVFAQFHHIHGADALPMRSVITRDAAYVFNPWSNGERTFRRLGGKGFDAMKSQPSLRARIRHLRVRTVEEFFDLRKDSNCLESLLGTRDAPRAESAMAANDRKALEALRASLREWMVRVKDPALKAFDRRSDSKALEKFVQDYRKEAARVKEELKKYEKANEFRF